MKYSKKCEDFPAEYGGESSRDIWEGKLGTVLLPLQIVKLNWNLMNYDIDVSQTIHEQALQLFY